MSANAEEYGGGTPRGCDERGSDHRSDPSLYPPTQAESELYPDPEGFFTHMAEATVVTPEMQHALEAARALARLGVPVFPLEPDSSTKTGYKTPLNWQKTKADPSTLDNWRPGMAIGAVTGHIFDVIDVDPRNGGDISALDGAMPEIYARTSTPSGGDHYWIRSIGQPKAQNINDGIDYQGGTPTPNSSDSHSRGFVFLPPTTRASKMDGVEHPYTWTQLPPTSINYQYQIDMSGTALANHIKNIKRQKATTTADSDVKGSDVYLTEGVPLGRQHEILSRIAWEKVTSNCGDMEIMWLMKGILAKSPQDMADPWTEDALMSLITSARNRQPVMYEPWMYEESIGLIERTRRAEGLDGGQVRRVHNLFIEEQARREARRLADANEAASTWSDLGQSSSLKDELVRAPETVDWLIPGMLGTNHNFLMIGKFKAGKTTLLVSMLKSLLDGTPFLDHYPVSDEVCGKHIGIWNGEMDDDEFINYTRSAKIHNTDRAEVMHLRGKGVPFLHNSPAREWTVNWLASNGIKIWVIDSMTALCKWNKVDKKDGSIDQLCHEIDLIKEEAGVECVVLLTHTPKNEEEGKETAYGAQELQAWADAWWLLTVLDDKRFLSAEGRRVHMDEVALEFDKETGLMILGEGSRYEYREAEKDRKMEEQKLTGSIVMQERVLDFIRDNPACGINEIYTGVVGNDKNKKEVIRDLITRGVVVISFGPNRKQMHTLAPE